MFIGSAYETRANVLLKYQFWLKGQELTKTSFGKNKGKLNLNNVTVVQYYYVVIASQSTPKDLMLTVWNIWITSNIAGKILWFIICRGIVRRTSCGRRCGLWPGGDGPQSASDKNIPHNRIVWLNKNKLPFLSFVYTRWIKYLSIGIWDETLWKEWVTHF